MSKDNTLKWMLGGEPPGPAEFKDAAQPLPEEPDEILAEVGDDRNRAAFYLNREKERGRKARRKLVTALEDIAAPTEPPPADPPAPPAT